MSADTFAVPSTVDGGATTMVADFSVADGDKIDLANWNVDSFATLQSLNLITKIGGNVALQIIWDGQPYALVLQGITDLSVLTEERFVFSTPDNDGDDFIGGGGNIDVLIGGFGKDVLYAYGGNDTLAGGADDDYVDGSTDNDVLFGDSGNDTLVGDTGNDTIWGGSGDDSLTGGSGSDILNGGTGKDHFDGGSGLDTLTGGADADTFAVPSTVDGGATTMVTDFSVADGDKIDLANWNVDSFATLQSLNLITKIGGNVALQIIWDGQPYALVLQGITDLSVLTEERFVFSTPDNDGDDFIGGGGNIDVLIGGFGKDVLYAYGGNDTLAGGADDDYVDGGTDNDVLFGGSGNDTLVGDTGNDTIWGGSGDDSLTGGSGSDILNGGTGKDHFDGGSGLDTLTGGADADTFAVPSTVDGGATTMVTDFSVADGDKIDLANWNVDSFATLQSLNLITKIGGNVALQIIWDGQPYALVLQGITDLSVLTEERFVFSTPDNDGDDFIGGGGNIDVLIGGFGKDVLYAYGGNDTLAGGADDDYVDGSTDNDVLFGGSGNDTLVGDTGNDTIWGGSGDDSLTGGSGSDILNGEEGSDTLLGGEDNDTLSGGVGSDLLQGGSGNDVLAGDAGRDVLDGGTGNDTLTGGADADRFVAPSEFSGSGAALVVTDFSVAEGDKIDLRAWGLHSIGELQVQGVMTTNGSSSADGAPETVPEGTVGLTMSREGVVNTVWLEGVTDPSVLTSQNFVFDPIKVTVPNALDIGETGMVTVVYYPPDVSDDAHLLRIDMVGALVADPLTGEFSESVMIAVPASPDGSPVTLHVPVRLGSADNASISVSVADPAGEIDWLSQKDALRPDSMSTEVWDRVFHAFVDSVGSTAASLTAAVTENADVLKSFGINGSSGDTALAFEIEQATDFGSLAARGATGSMGQGWQTTADIALQKNADGTFQIQGLSDFAALFSLSGADAARYTLSASVDRSIDLQGQIGGGDAPVPLVLSRDASLLRYSGPDGTTLTVDREWGVTFPENHSPVPSTVVGYFLTTANGSVLHFNPDGRLLDARNPSGDVTTATYDVNGHMIGLVDEAGHALRFVRDAFGHVTTISDSSGYSVGLEYSADHKLLLSADGATGKTEFEFNADGDLAGADLAGAAPKESFSYDGHGRLTGIAVHNSPVESYAYNSTGGYTITDGAGVEADVTLLPGGAVGSVTDAQGHSSGFLFDAGGNLIGARDAAGNVSGIVVDSAGRAVSVTDPTGAIFHLTYDGDSTRPASMTDANGATRTFAYDAEGHMTTASWPDGKTLAFSYDDHGNLTGYENRRGDGIDQTYDSAGRLISSSDSAAGPVTYAYDADGRLISATTAEGATTISYDAAGHVTDIGYPDGRSLSYDYDDAGRRTAMTDQDGHAQIYTYDPAGHLATVADEHGVQVTYSYDAAGRLTGEDNANGTSTSYGYDTAGRLASIVNRAPGGSENSHVTYTYDAGGQRVSMDTQDGHWAYGYDDAGQLTAADFTSAKADLADKHLSYAYDAAGNRTSSVEDGVTTTYVANNLNQYVSAGDATYSYDADGNMVSRTESGGTTSYGYDALNRLESVTADDGTVTEYKYDVFGNRSTVIENGVETDYLIDPFGLGNVVGEYAADGTLKASYLYGLGLAARVDGTGSHGFFDMDGVASVTGVTNAAGAVVGSYGYTPFGQTLYQNESVDNAFEFNGGLGVSEDTNGLIYMRARQYDAELGRFTGEDPLWLSGDVGNLSRFASNDPVSLVDPKGENGNFVGASLIGVAAGAAALGAGAPILLVGGVVFFAAYGAYEIFDATAHFGESYAHAVENPSREAVRDVSINAYSASKEAFGGALSLSVGARLGEGAGVAFDLGGFISEKIFGQKKHINLPANPVPSASSNGDPHLLTFDGLAYDFQAAGEFTLARVSEHGFELQVRQEAIPNSAASLNTAIAMRLNGSVIEFHGSTSELLINGNVVTLEPGDMVAIGNGIISHASDGSWVFANVHGEGVSFTDNGGYLNIQPFVATEDAGKVTGLLGNFNGDSADDIALANGTVLAGPVADNQLYGAFADSWRLTDSTSIFTYAPGESTTTYTKRDFPSQILTIADFPPEVRAAAEQAAIDAGLVPGTVAFNNAVLDVALTGNTDFAHGAVGTGTDPDNQPDVLEINHAPTGISTAVFAHGMEDAVYVTSADKLLSGFSDLDHDALSISDLAADHGADVVQRANGTISITPAADFNGSLQLSYSIDDGRGGKRAMMEAIVFEAVNDAPRIASGIVGQAVSEDSSFNFIIPAASFTDADAGDTLSYTASLAGGSKLPSWLHFNTLTGAFSGTPVNRDVGTVSIKVTAFDGHGGSARTNFDLVVANTNDAPTHISLSSHMIRESSAAGTVVGTLGGTDPDADDTLIFSLSSNPGGVFGVTDGELVLAHGKKLDFETRSSYTVILTATDEAGASIDAAFTINVTDVKEPIVGTSKANTLHGTSHADIIQGLGGNDILDGGDGGDVLNGGKGLDTASYASAHEGVLADLEKPVHNTGYAHGDIYIGIENLIGSKLKDILSGDDKANMLDGGRGNDVLTGGAGNDHFVFGSKYGNDTITDFHTRGKAQDFIDLGEASGISGFKNLIQHHIKDLGDDLLISDSDGSTLLVEAVNSVKDLVRGDFLF